MIRFVYYHDRTYRVLYETEQEAWIIDWETPKAPIRIAIPEQLLQADIPAGFLDESVPSDKRRRTMEKRLELLRPLIEQNMYIYDVHRRREKIAQLAKNGRVSEKTLTRQYYAYLAKGERGLLPASKSARTKSQKEQNIDKDIRKSINKHYYSPQKMSLRNAYEMYLLEHWRGENGKLRDDAPNFARYQRNYNQIRSEYKKIISRNGIGDYQKNYRPLLGSTAEYARNCGIFEVDATEADVDIVSKYSRKPIGRPIVYLAVDVASRLVTGVHVGLSYDSNSILLCLCCAVEDKVAFCKKYGIDITAEQWPSSGLPAALSIDRGPDFMSGRVRELCERFELEITNLPAYRPDLKGCVEKTFDIIQKKYLPLLYGHGAIDAKQDVKRYKEMRTRAKLDLYEYTKILIKCIVYYNSSRVIPIQREPAMIADNVPPIASEIWNWLISKGRTNLIQTNLSDMFLMLLPRGDATITRSGLLFNGLRYDTTVCDMTPDYVDAGVNGNRKVTVAYHEDSVKEIYLINNGTYISFCITASSMFFADDLTFAEVRILRQDENEARKSAIKKQVAESVECTAYIKQVIDEVELIVPHSAQDVTNAKKKKEREKEKHE